MNPVQNYIYFCFYYFVKNRDIQVILLTKTPPVPTAPISFPIQQPNPHPLQI